MAKRIPQEDSKIDLIEAEVDITYVPDYGSKGPADETYISSIKYRGSFYKEPHFVEGLTIKFSNDHRTVKFKAIVSKERDSGSITLGGMLEEIRLESLKRLQAVNKYDMENILEKLEKLRPDAKSLLEEALAIKIKKAGKTPKHQQ
jgi:hypothetical protein